MGNVDRTFLKFPDLRRLFNPRSVAVVGASEQPGNLGGVAVQLMQKYGYAGHVWPVNPKQASVFGLPCVVSPADLPAAADLAIIATGAALAGDIVRQCAAADIRHGVIWAGGYSETGPQGAALQAELMEICRETGFMLVGPNSIGVINAREAMVASFASFLVEGTTLVPGDIAMISQSGGLATMAQSMAQERGFGIGLTISSGNEAMLTAADYIHAAALDPATRIIAAYIEGIRDGDRFIEAVSAARRAGKPVVILKGGRTAMGAKAAAAHTGALAGEKRVWDAITSEFGIMPVGSLEGLLDTLEFLSRTDLEKLPKGNSVAIVSFGGGSGVLSADQCQAHGLKVASFDPRTTAALKSITTPIASIANPIDLTPQTFNSEQWFAHLPAVLDTIAEDPNVDIVFCQFGPQARNGPATARLVADLRDRTEKTVCLAWPLASIGVPAVLKERKLCVFTEYERAIATLARFTHAGPSRPARPETREPTFDWRAEVPSAETGMVIGEDECHRILSKAGIAVARGTLTRGPREEREAARRIGFPVAAKGISPAVTHRAAAGLLALDIRNEEELAHACAGLRETAHGAGIELDGIYLQEMVPGRQEVILAAFRDPVFGIMISCGSGGYLTEIIDDVTLARAPLDEAFARAMLERLKIVDAEKEADRAAGLDALAGFVAHFSQVCASAPWRRFVLELNPVKWSGQRLAAVDGLLIIEES